ncbi:tRNA (adenosine(37)-N6)-dimethylallyltransferase MiaA [Candidatus Dependentiae bacterium]|nr:tRNA (adenosine(37)-N6)-dimethylallyltransferase MiaA [Candidatus Dependentiae bacterium]
MKNDNDNNFVILISGPTASGKTDLSLEVGNFLPVEIINADMGQFYTPFSIGTAKPDWKKQKIKHHLFDILNTPKDLSVAEYTELVKEKINLVWKKNKIPVIVGGSLFYIKSLFFPPKKIKKINQCISFEDQNLWELLNKIDPIRASHIHPNDEYRLKRALDIWKETGLKPSQIKPDFSPFFNSFFIHLNLEKDVLYKRIEKRTKKMFDLGWVKEVEKILGSDWESFFLKKGLIGYKNIVDWIKNGKDKKQFDCLVEEVIKETKLYAKRQKTFWKSFKKHLQKESKNPEFICKIIELDCKNIEDFKFLKNYFLKEINFFVADN